MPTAHPFRFQRFSIHHDRVAMKVGTDAVLLGAWTPLRHTNRILEIGTGSGIVALMLAQRSESLNSQISAIDIDQNAAEQSVENFLRSPWSSRLPRSPEQVHTSVQDFVERDSVESDSERFDLIVSNPPYFVDSFRPDVKARSVARHVGDGFQHALFECCRKFLSTAGSLCLIVPCDQLESTINSAATIGLRPRSQVFVKGNESADPKRVLIELTFGELTQSSRIETLIVEQKRHQHTPQFADLTRNFFLRYQTKDDRRT